MFAIMLAEKLKRAGAEVILSYPDKPEHTYGSMTKFLIAKLRMPVDCSSPFHQLRKDVLCAL